MDKSKFIYIGLALVIFVLSAFVFKGNTDLKEVKNLTKKIEETNKKLIVENNKLKASVKRYNQIADSLSVSINGLNSINNDVREVLSHSISSFKKLNGDISDIVAHTNEAIELSNSVESDDNLEPIIP